MKSKTLVLTLIGIIALFGTLLVIRAQEDAEACPSDTFVDASNDPDVLLEITCTEDTMVIETNNLPNYQVPGTTEAQTYTWYIPLEPQVAEEPIEIPLLDAVAVAVDGIQIHGPNGAPFDGYPDPVHEEMLVFCGGHHAAQTLFHHHASPDCLYEQLVENPDDETQLVGVVLGYAFDGYPILAPYICVDEACTEVTELESSWQRTQDVTNAWEANEYVEGSGDLDQCNGMELEDGSYAYFATHNFPYFLGCYHGIPDERSIEVARPSQGEQRQPAGGGQQPPTGGQGGQQPPTGGQGGQQPPPPPPTPGR
jgi:hypothetical protein